MRSLRELLGTIYDSYSDDGGGGQPFFDERSAELRRFRSSDVVAAQVRQFDASYVYDFLLSSPELLLDLTSDDWRDAFVHAGPRPALEPGDLSWEHYADIGFVCKFLRLDAVRAALDNEALPEADKRNIGRVASLMSPLLVLDEVDAESLDGAHFVSQSFLRETARRLYAEGGWEWLPDDVDALADRMRPYARLVGAL